MKYRTFFHPADEVDLSDETAGMAAAFCGAEAWPQPWEQEAFVSSNLAKLVEFCATSPEVAAEREYLAAKAKATTEDDASRDALILSITGKDRAAVMAGKGEYWPIITEDRLAIDLRNSTRIEWRRGDCEWGVPFCTRGNRDDEGAGFVSNQ